MSYRGLAVGSASNLAQEASDVVLMTNNLTQLLIALHLAVKVIDLNSFTETR